MRLAALACGAALAAARSTPECTFTVSPTQPDALHAVQRQIRALFASSKSSSSPLDSVLVCLEPGTFRLTAPLAFTAEDNHPVPGKTVTFRTLGAPGSTLISGGVPVTGWSATMHAGSPAYAAPVPSSLGATTVLRQLWVDDARASRVIAPSASALFGGSMTGTWDATTSTAGYTVKSFPAGFGTDANATMALEFTYPIVIHNWIAPRCVLSAADPSSLSLTLSSPCGSLLHAAAGGVPVPVTAEAVPAQALAPGTFYHDITAGQIYYSLAPGQSASDLETSAFVAGLEVLVSKVNVTGFNWQGITFAYATWGQPNRPEGYVDQQSAVFDCTPTSNTPGCFDGSTAEPKGAVRVAGSSAISFTGCTFLHIGAAYALSIDEGSNSSSVIGCNFTDLSGGFFKLGSIDETYANGAGPTGWDSSSVLSDTYASDMAVEFGGAAGLFAGYVVNATVLHNSISDAGYDGMSMGWGWGANAVALTGFGGNTIVGNKFSHVMHALRDGGGIYLNGKTNVAHGYTFISQNYVDSDEAVFAVYYEDNGSSYNNLTLNVATNSPLAWAFFMTDCCGLPAYNSTTSYMWYENTLDPQNNCGAYGCTVDESTIFKLPAGSPLPPAAQAIVDASGVRPSVWAAVQRGDWEAVARLASA
jgi:hypothetical protein